MQFNSSAKKHHTFQTLDSWRGICALMVALAHFSANSHINTYNIVINASFYVDFFFVLSGFVIAANYITRFTSISNIGSFMFLRFGRLYPMLLGREL